MVVGLIAVSIIAITAVVYVVIQDKKITRFDAIDIIASKTSTDKNFLNNGDTGYLIAWATALKNSKKNFSSAGINYQSSDGNAVV